MKVEVEGEIILEGQIKAYGTGAHITIPKKYLGRNAKVVIE